MRRTKLFNLAMLAVAWLAGGSALAQLDANKVYTIVNNNDANMFMQDNGTGGVDLSAENENSYWKFVPTTNADCYYIQNATTGKYIQGYTAAEQEVATGDTGVEYYVKADATGTYAGKYRMSCTANSPHDFSAGTLGLNWKNPGTVQSFASVAEGNPRSAWTLTAITVPTPDPGTDVTWDEPAQVEGVYQIGTASELEWFAEYVNSVTGVDDPEKDAKLNAQAVLTADIDLTGIDHSPIGRYTNESGAVIDTYKYSGKFDGQFHTISNLVINRPDDEALGLFGFVRGNAKIKNIIMDSTCSITGKNRVGSIIGLIQTNTGASDGLEILNCVSYATLTTTSGAAGMIGAGCEQYPYFDMENCVNAGTVSAVNRGSAFCGWNKSAGGNARMWNCLNIAEISVLDGNNQLFRGANRSIANCYDTFHSASNFQGEHPTYTTADPLHSGEICYLLNTALRSDLAEQANPNAQPFTQDLSDPNSIPLPIPGKAVYQVAALDCAGNPKGGVAYSNEEGGSTQDDHEFDPATGLCTVCSAPKVDWMSAEADGYYILHNVAEVEWFSRMVKNGYGAMNAKLANDIDYEGVANAHLPIGTSAKKFFGHFDGQGHRIKGMVLTTASALENRGFDGQGFFGSVRGGGTSVDGITNNEVIIENLIIDSSCSIEHDNNFAAGVVAHVNSRNNNDSHIIIRYCGNEANVSSTGKNIAGILGCVEATEVGLTIKQCYNTGNIYGGAGESAAICGWTGTPKDYLVKEFSGCWNIGEVTGIDGNGYNLVRAGKLNNELYPAVINSVDLCTTNGGNQGKVTINTENPIQSGELCYLLNGDQSEITWTQDLGVEDMPNMWGTTSQVFQAGTKDCTGTAVGGVTYNNTSGETIVLPHNINDEIGMCDVCYTQFQEPALVDGYYELKNAGNVEWFSHKVDEGGDANLQINGKLMNDIDMLGIENLHLPIGVNTGKKYNGTFDGQGFRIKNMIIERPSDSNIGFFGFLRGNAANTTVKNLIMDKSCTIHGYNRVGGITGSCQNNGALITLENIINEATVTAEHQDAAGIIGGQEGNGPKWLIRNVLNTGTITAKNEAPYAGALCCYLGGNNESVIENFVNLGTINGHRGGNIGRIAGTHTNIIDLSDTDFDSSLETNYGLDSGLEKTDIANGKLAYTVGWGQLIGTDEYPTPLNDVEVCYVGDAGYATLYDSTTGYQLNGDVVANSAVFNAGWLIMSEIGTDVPAGTPVILKGTYYNKLEADLPALNIANDLLGTDEDLTADGSQYVLAIVDDELGFYRVRDYVPAGKAYYQSASGVKAFGLIDDDADGISNLNETVNENAAIYNVAGQRLQKMQKGINIVGGKKVLIK